MAHITGDTYPLGPEDVGLQVSVRVTLQGPSGREAKSDATSSMVRVPWRWRGRGCGRGLGGSAG